MNIAIPQPDYAAIKVKQKATWGAGDYAVIGTTLADRRRAPDRGD